jgi:hypothetical protein
MTICDDAYINKPNLAIIHLCICMVYMIRMHKFFHLFKKKTNYGPEIAQSLKEQYRVRPSMETRERTKQWVEKRET